MSAPLLLLSAFLPLFLCSYSQFEFHHSFNSEQGCNGGGQLFKNDGLLYGWTQSGGKYGDGSGFRVFLSFFFPSFFFFSPMLFFFSLPKTLGPLRKLSITRKRKLGTNLSMAPFSSMIKGCCWEQAVLECKPFSLFSFPPLFPLLPPNCTEMKEFLVGRSIPSTPPPNLLSTPHYFSSHRTSPGVIMAQP